ncbi:MAG: type II toxin-antitoxin system VapC family toxin [candidate division WOR-3 bacterium]
MKRKKSHNEICEKKFLQAVEELDKKWEFFNIITIEPIFAMLKNKVIQYSLKALDAIHLASALWIKEELDNDVSFVCSDKELLEFAKKEGLNIINPERTI